MLSPLTKRQNIAGSAVSKQSVSLASIDTFLQDPGIDDVEYLVSVSAHHYLYVMTCIILMTNKCQFFILTESSLSDRN